MPPINNNINNVNSNSNNVDLLDKLQSLTDALNTLIQERASQNNNTNNNNANQHTPNWKEFLDEIKKRNKDDQDAQKQNDNKLKELNNRIERYGKRLGGNIIKRKDTKKLYKQTLSESKTERTKILSDNIRKPINDVNSTASKVVNASMGEKLSKTLSLLFPKLATKIGSMLTKVASKIIGGLTKFAGPIGIIAGIIKGIVKMIIQLYDAAANIGKRFGIAKDATYGIRDNLNKAALYSNTMGTSLDDMVQALDSMSKLSGGTGTNMIKYLSTQRTSLDTQNALTKAWGLTTDTSAQFVNILKLAGVDQKNIAGSMLELINVTNKWSGGLINARDVIKQIGDAGADIITWMHTLPDAIMQATLEANKMGTTLTGLSDISKNILQFQSSVQAVMEANVLTGRSMNFNMARYLSLQGDLAGAAREISTQLGGYEKFNELNIKQQELIAKAVGMSTKQLAEMLVKQEGLAKASAMLGIQLTDTSKLTIDQQKKLSQSGDKAIQAFIQNYQNLTFQEQIQALQLKATQALSNLIAKVPTEKIINGLMTVISGIVKALSRWPFKAIDRDEADSMISDINDAKLDVPNDTNNIAATTPYDNTPYQNTLVVRNNSQYATNSIPVRNQNQTAITNSMTYQNDLQKLMNTMNTCITELQKNNNKPTVVRVDLEKKPFAQAVASSVYSLNTDTGGRGRV